MTKIEKLEQQLKETKNSYELRDYEMKQCLKEGRYSQLNFASSKRSACTVKIKKLEEKITQAKIEWLQKIKTGVVK